MIHQVSESDERQPHVIFVFDRLTAQQALRLAALDIRRSAGVDLPVVVDDVLMTSDEGRSGAMLQALSAFSQGTHGTPGSQVIVFTHHRHLVEVAQRHVAAEGLAVVGI